jgi:tetratricopeptide (TPR) repeat protein
MANSDTDLNLVDRLAEDFARRWRAGECPSPDEYAARHPDHADEIRDVCSGVILMERLKPRPDDQTEPAPAEPFVPRPAIEVLGDYRIVREIGRGGMGVVYEAVQESLGRRVAIKVLSPQLQASEKVLSRFRQEARAAAGLHHTNIVPVFGVGEADGHCFYVMQLIEGWGLNVEESAHHHSIARIGVQVADALAYAHTQGVIHRDIKPSNLLLDERGTVWVTDFGVAKVMAAANITQSGEVVGTLRYMPPEQFAGRADSRGDVYSLGVTLAELLIRGSAFPDTTPLHLMQLITEIGIERPRRIDPNIPTDLETIVLKAAARDPVHRYQTAAELADDLRRFLDDRPIRARRTGPLRLAWRWCRRNPAIAGSLAVAMLLLVAVAVVSFSAYLSTAAAYTRVDSANRETAAANIEMRAALDSETQQREQAERASTLALAALNRLYDRFALTRLVAAPPAGDEPEAGLPRPPALPPEAVPLMEELLRTYQQLARSGGVYPKLRPQAAEANHRIGDIGQRLGRFDASIAAYRAAIELYEQSPRNGDTGIKLARACTDLAQTLRAVRRSDEADRYLLRAIETLKAAPPADAARPEHRYELARTYYVIAQRDKPASLRTLGQERSRSPESRGDAPPAKPLLDRPLQQSNALAEKLVHDHESVPEYRHLLARCYIDLPADRGQWPTVNTDRAADLLRQLVAAFPKVPDYRFDLSEALGRPRPGTDDEHARKRMKEAIELSAPLVADYPNVPDYAAARARYLTEYGVSLFLAGQIDQAESYLRLAVAAQEKLVAEHPAVAAYVFWLSVMERNLGRVLCERRHWTESRQRLESAIARLEALRSADPRLGSVRPQLRLAYIDLARALTGAGEAALATEAERRGRELGGDRARDPFNPRNR